MVETRLEGEPERPEPGTVPPAEPPSASEASLGELFRQLAQDSTTLIRQEVALARTEIRDGFRQAVREAAMIGVGGAIALVGLLALTAFLILILGEALASYWLAALLVALLYLLVGGGLAWRSLQLLRRNELKPAHTLDSLKEDKRWLEQEIRDVRKET